MREDLVVLCLGAPLPNDRLYSHSSKIKEKKQGLLSIQMCSALADGDSNAVLLMLII